MKEKKIKIEDFQPDSNGKCQCHACQDPDFWERMAKQGVYKEETRERWTCCWCGANNPRSPADHAKNCKEYRE